MTVPAEISTPRSVQVEDASQVPLARALAAEVSRQAGFSAHRVSEIDLAATELAENLHRHAVAGELMVLPPDFGPDDTGAVVLVAIDRGPGVESFQRCLVDGYSTAGTMGTGLGAVRRLASSFDAVSEPERGTVVAATFYDVTRSPRSAEPLFDVAAIGLPTAPEVVNGDGFAIARRGHRLVAIVADGLGHGPDAATASAAVVDVLGDHADLSPAAVLLEAGRRAAHTRGAAATVVDLVRNSGEVVCAGMGNVSLLLVAPDATTKRVATSHGTVGVHGRAPVERREPLAKGGLVVLHTDGLTSRWTLDARTELLQHSALVIAAALWRDFIRGTDDSLVVVIRADDVSAGQ